MNDLTIVFINDPGVLGYIVFRGKSGVIRARYYLDGISYSVSLEKDEYRIFTGGDMDE